MVRIDEINAEIARRGLKKKELAKLTGIKEARLYRLLRPRKEGEKPVSMADEDIDKLQKVLKFSDPHSIFFAHDFE